MNVHFTYKLSKTADLENLITQRIEKLQKRLQVFRPDMVALYGSVDEHPKMGFNVALNLRLPSGQLAAREVGDTAQSAIKICFESLKEQLAKHMDHLRASYKWPNRRRAAGRTRAETQVPFEETLASVQADVVSAQDINGWLNANLEKLQRFVERELRHRSNSGQARVQQITPEEVMSEAIANALDGRTEKPEKFTLEPWLYFLSRAAIDRLAEQAGNGQGEVGLDSSVRREEASGSDSDEAMLQFHQPDEMLTNENVISDGGTATPEDIAASDEVMGMIETVLRHAHHQDREAFILFTMEGFTVQEIAVITERKPEEVRTSIAKAREQLRKALPVAEQLRNKLIEHSKSA
jgi:RNA polymerase sigma factor (sigma-70 family)